MNKIPVVLWLELWDMVREAEWQTDGGMAKILGIPGSTVHSWRKHKVEAVLPHHARNIEVNLSYDIRLVNGQWELKKLPPPSKQTDDPTHIYSNTSISEEEMKVYQDLSRLVANLSIENARKVELFINSFLTEEGKTDDEN